MSIIKKYLVGTIDRDVLLKDLGLFLRHPTVDFDVRSYCDDDIELENSEDLKIAIESSWLTKPVIHMTTSSLSLTSWVWSTKCAEVFSIAIDLNDGYPFVPAYSCRVKRVITNCVSNNSSFTVNFIVDNVIKDSIVRNTSCRSQVYDIDLELKAGEELYLNIVKTNTEDPNPQRVTCDLYCNFDVNLDQDVVCLSTYDN